MNEILRTLFAGLLIAGLAACEQNQGPAEKAGEKVDKAMENAGEQIGKTADEAGEAMESAGDRMREKTEQ